MANQTDFLDLYEKLSLDPGCGLTEFRQAYRRHVAMLHPDRPTATQTDHETARSGPLQELIAQYGAAMEFHRRHGRLPGAATPPLRFAASVAARAPHPKQPSPMPSSAPLRTAPGPRPALLVLLAVVATGVLLWNVSPVALLTETTPVQTPTTDDGDPSGSMTKSVLSIGMSMAGVRAIEGDPRSVHGGRWEYGLSWISFDHGVVVDWSSSPLHPLHVASNRPPGMHDE
ncbi:J domain-containing protein [Rhodanobacter sp. Col0626]|uniref:J domain-containing protein n=1 Tax=Rhodanobacter sp. Col0626 TaxID=3415679 RepID=UPI003CEC3356